MGGKNYFCDYCRCYMKNDVNVRKSHNAGLAHLIEKTRVLRPYQDPLEVYEAERTKAPCTRFQKGYCKFDLFCHFGHYTPMQLQQLKEIGERQAKKPQQIGTNEEHSPEKDPYEHLLPWHQNSSNPKKPRRLQRNLPESLKPINFDFLRNSHLETEWG